VFELKIGEFKPEFAGKLNFYLNAVDTQIKTAEDKSTIGVLLCKTPNETVIEYALRGIDKPMGVADFALDKALPDTLKTDMPTVEELEQELEKEIEEFKENQNPVDARLKAIKEKLKNIQADEIQTQVTHNILLNLFNEGLKPMYQQIIDKLSVFEEEFHSKMFVWNCTNKVIVNLQQLEDLWKDEDQIRLVRDVFFEYNLYGFKKAGTQNFSETLRLKFEMDTYWYGFSLISHNNHGPFLKKLYHQPLTSGDRQQIMDVMVSAVMDRIDWIIEHIKKEGRK